MRIFDVHTHVFSPWVKENRHNIKDPLFLLLYSDPKAKMVGTDELLSNMVEEGVLHFVACGFPWGDLELCKRENDYLLESHQKHPELLPFVTFPADEKGLKELERCAKGGARGAGELAPGTYGDRLIDKGYLRELFLTLKALDLPALIHVNEPVGHPYPGKGKVCLRDIEALLVLSEGAKLILAHMGGGFFFYELMPEVKELCRNVYYDTAALPFLYGPKVWRVAMELIPDKLLFGTDYPLLGPKRYLKSMEEGGLGEREREKILWENVLRFFGS